MRPIYRLPLRVRSYEVDPQGRLHGAVLCRLLQEAATNHAAALGVAVESLIDAGVAWVLSRLQLSMQRWPGVGDDVVIETWPEALDRLTTERRFEVRGAGGEYLGSASTLWLVLDLQRRRPIRIPAAISDALSRHDIGDLPHRPRELEGAESAEIVAEFAVGRKDVDLAGHANNTSYVEWALEAVPDDVWADRVLAELDIGFRAECRRGAVIRSACHRVEGCRDVELVHRLDRADDGVTAALARTVWRRVT